MIKVNFSGGRPLQKKISSSWLVAVILAGGGFAANAEAAGLRSGITPMIKLSSQWDSNFFRTSANEEKVTTYLVQPGVTVDLKTPRSFLALSYTLDSHTYKGIDQDLDFIGHTFDTRLGSQTTSGKLQVKLAETYRLSRDPQYLDPLGDSVSRQKYAINTLAPELVFQAGQATFKLGYQNVMIDYSDPAGEDSKQNTGTAEVAVKVGRLSSVGLQSSYITMDYENTTTDYNDTKAKAIYERKGKALTLKAGVGWMWRKFDQSAGAGGFDKFDEPVADLSLGWQSPNKTTLTLAAGYGVNSVQDENTYYEATKVSLDFGHEFGNGATIGLNTVYQDNDYKFQPRIDKTWKIGATLLYPLARWLDLSAGAGYQSRNSTLDIHDYDNTYGQVGVNFKYPVGSAVKEQES